ncbi:FNIp repeat-containing protein [Saudi moumouvirus]|nr:FNIp repeat-containing protein [Saudi moumouvirus]
MLYSFLQSKNEYTYTKCLEFGYYFNQPIKKGVLPEGLIHLSLNYKFNQILEPGSIPDTVKILNIYSSCEKSI